MSGRPVLHVAYAVPADSRKSTLWRDGFTAAIELLGARFDTRWLNLHPSTSGHRSALERLADCDVVLAKSNWGWIVDRLVRRRLRRSRPPAALMISGVADPPRRRRMCFYDLLFYETPWYERRIASHPRRVHAFGVDTRVMRPAPHVERDVDWLSVGALKPYKRHGILRSRDGRRVVVGDSAGADPATVATLREAGVELHDYCSYEELAGWYRRARNVLVGATTDGGGERALLEARACGARTHVPDDNPKLRGLLEAPVWDHRYYADRLGEGLDALAAS
jgi:hypothetical protein